MRKITVVIASVLSVCLAALGFNTLDWMTHICPPETWCFCWGVPPTLCMPFWYAYFFGGVLPLTLGGLFAGLIIGIVVYPKLRKRKK